MKRALVVLGAAVALPLALRSGPLPGIRPAHSAVCDPSRALAAESLAARPDVRPWLPDVQANPRAERVVLRDSAGATFAVYALSSSLASDGALLLFACDGLLLDAELSPVAHEADLVSLGTTVPPLVRTRVAYVTAVSSSGVRRSRSTLGPVEERVRLYVVRDSALRYVWGAGEPAAPPVPFESGSQWLESTEESATTEYLVGGEIHRRVWRPKITRDGGHSVNRSVHHDELYVWDAYFDHFRAAPTPP